MEKVQLKYTSSDGAVVIVRVESSSAWIRHKYSPEEVDWLAVFEPTTGYCFYLPPSLGRPVPGQSPAHPSFERTEKGDQVRERILASGPNDMKWWSQRAIGRIRLPAGVAQW